MLSMREREAAAMAAQEAKFEAQEERLREACCRVSFKAISHIEAGYELAQTVLEAAVKNMEDAGLTPREKHVAMLEFARSFNRMLDVSSRIVAVAIARTKRPEGRDERSGWIDLVEELKGAQKKLGPPKEIVVKAERKAG